MYILLCKHGIVWQAEIGRLWPLDISLALPLKKLPIENIILYYRWLILILKMLAPSEILIDFRLCIDPMYIGINVTNFFPHIFLK